MSNGEKDEGGEGYRIWRNVCGYKIEKLIGERRPYEWVCDAIISSRIFESLEVLYALVKEIVQDLLIYSGIKIIEQTYSTKYKFTLGKKNKGCFVGGKKRLAHLLLIFAINKKVL